MAITTVDVWRSDLELDQSALDRLWPCLDHEEQGRAARFYFEADRTRFIASRATLRHILGQYLGQEPERVRLGYAAEGKPHLLDQRDLHFNLSHAGSLLLVAVSRSRQVGVDVERVPSEALVAEVSERVFSPPELAALGQLLGPARCERFAEFWTRKEAYIKARGTGLSLPLDSFRVGFGPGMSPSILSARGEPDAAVRWALFDLQPFPEFAGALVVERPVGNLCCWRVS